MNLRSRPLNPVKRSILPFAILSLLTHLIAFVIVAGRAADAEFASPLKLTLQREKEDQIELGVEKSNAVTITWLGFADPTEHSAPKSSIDQAALSPSPASSSPQRTMSLPSLPTVNLPETAEVVELLQRLREATIQIAAEQAEQRPADTPEPPAPPEIAKPAPEKPAQSEQPAPQTTPAIESTKESPASSKLPTVDFKPGRPLAAEGLDITTASFDFDPLTRLTALPRNPLVEITFGANGKPEWVAFVPGQNSGWSDVDRKIINKIYEKWSAKGKAIDELKAGKRTEVVVPIRILLR